MSAGCNLRPKPLEQVKPCRAGTKRATLIDILARPKGATLAELIAATASGRRPWAQSTARAALNWDVHTVKGYGIRTTLRSSGEHCFHLVLPAGLEHPLRHLPRTPSKRSGGPSSDGGR
ncbi:DUF3489 domain-containing protein [Acuticoccus sp. MNP-M23]|uniref:DUF3489 domain-containing protein n=1 Tax=Acuticoccus sp. MNP-M23 TaxID=3072793 RepID=UPI0035C08B9F